MEQESRAGQGDSRLLWRRGEGKAVLFWDIHYFCFLSPWLEFQAGAGEKQLAFMFTLDESPQPGRGLRMNACFYSLLPAYGRQQ